MNLFSKTKHSSQIYLRNKISNICKSASFLSLVEWRHFDGINRKRKYILWFCIFSIFVKAFFRLIFSLPFFPSSSPNDEIWLGIFARRENFFSKKVKQMEREIWSFLFLTRRCIILTHFEVKNFLKKSFSSTNLLNFFILFEIKPQNATCELFLVNVYEKYKMSA